jgi:TatD DNase family protein
MNASLLPGPFVDAHCHVDLYEDPAWVVEEAAQHRVFTIAVTNAPSVFFHTEKLVSNSRYVRAAVGLHPELIHSHGHELDAMWPLLERTRYVGEVGLDYTTSDESLRSTQRRVFSTILDRCANEGNKILTVHSRRAASDVISSFGPSYPGRMILHWFSGSNAEADRGVAYGAFFSINPAMLRSKKGRALIERIPRERILTESDGPFVSVAEGPARPLHARSTVEALAAVWKVDPSEAAAAIFQNFTSLLSETPQEASSIDSPSW